MKTPNGRKEVSPMQTAFILSLLSLVFEFGSDELISQVKDLLKQYGYKHFKF